MSEQDHQHGHWHDHEPPAIGEAPSHAQVQDLFADYLADELTTSERAQVERHLTGCDTCRAALAETHHLRTLLRGLGYLTTRPTASPADSLADAIMARLEEPGAFSSPERGPIEAPQPAEKTVRPLFADDGVVAPATSNHARVIQPTWRPHRPTDGSTRATTDGGWQMASDDDREHGTEQSTQPFTLLSPRPRGEYPSLRATDRRWPGVVAALVLIGLSALIFGTLGLHSRGTQTGGRSTPAGTQTDGGLTINLTPTIIARNTSISTAEAAKSLPALGYLNNVRMVSATDGWAVGETDSGNKTTTLIAHYDGEHWNLAHETFANATVSDIAPLPSGEAWAVGTIQLADPSQWQVLMLHYTHGQWTRVANTTSGHLNKLQMLSADEGWALGSGGEGVQGSMMMHYSHGTWTATHLAADDLHGLAFVSPTEGWVSGYGTILHYYDGTWTTARSNIAGNLLTLAMRSPSDGWAAGFDYNSHALFFHYDGSTWQQVSVAPGSEAGVVYGLAVLPNGDAWAVGSGGKGAQAPGETRSSLLLHFTHGQWSASGEHFNVDLNSVSFGDVNEGWAAGARSPVGGANMPALAHYTNGVWTVSTGG